MNFTELLFKIVAIYHDISEQPMLGLYHVGSPENAFASDICAKRGTRIWPTYNGGSPSPSRNYVQLNKFSPIDVNRLNWSDPASVHCGHTAILSGRHTYGVKKKLLACKTNESPKALPLGSLWFYLSIEIFFPRRVSFV